MTSSQNDQAWALGHPNSPSRKRCHPSLSLPATPHKEKGEGDILYWGYDQDSSDNLYAQDSEKDSTARGENVLKDNAKIKKGGETVETPAKIRGKTASCFVREISEVLLSGRSHDLIKFQQLVVPTLLHNKHWRKEFREHISHNYMTC